LNSNWIIVFKLPIDEWGVLEIARNNELPLFPFDRVIKFRKLSLDFWEDIKKLFGWTRLERGIIIRVGFITGKVLGAAFKKLLIMLMNIYWYAFTVRTKVHFFYASTIDGRNYLLESTFGKLGIRTTPQIIFPGKVGKFYMKKKKKKKI